MRKYDCLTNSSYFDQNLRAIDSHQKQTDEIVKKNGSKVYALKEKFMFVYWMLHLKKTLKLARKDGQISIKDYCVLLDLWFRVLFRIYRTA